MRSFIFSIIILTLSFLIYIYPLNIATYLLLNTKVTEPFALIPTLVIAVGIYVFFKTHYTSPLLGGVIHYGMGIGFIGFWLFNLGLIVCLALPSKNLEIGLICCFMTIVICVRSCANGSRIHIKNINFSSPKIDRPIEIVFISDVHLGSNPKQHLEKICGKISQLDYQYLLIGGDLFDSSAFQASDLYPLKRIQKPILYVTGNHEYYVKNSRNRIAELAQYDVTILDNRSEQFGILNIIGISDHTLLKAQTKITETLICKEKFNLVLVHKPSIWENVAENLDLMLSGHTHNGQIFPFNLFVRLQFKTVYGIYKKQSSNLYVSSGSGTWGPRMRFMSQNEVVKILLTPQRIN